MSKAKRLIPRILTVLVKNAEIISWASYIAGLVAVLLLPVLGNNNHISENAIMAGSAHPKFGQTDATYAITLVGNIRQAARAASADCNGLQQWIAGQLESMGVESHSNSVASTEASPFSLSTCKARHDHSEAIGQGDLATAASSCGGTNLVSVLRAPKGEGTEAIVLVTPLRHLSHADWSEGLTDGDATALGLGLAVMRVLANVPWLARDIIWLVADTRGRNGAYGAVSQWLEEYHFPSMHRTNSSRATCAGGSGGACRPQTSHDFVRCGTISFAIVVEMDESYREGAFDLVQLRAEGPNGEMPNLDLVATAQQLASWREGLAVEIETSAAIAESGAVSFIGSAVESVGKLLSTFDRKWGLDTRDNYIRRASALAKFMTNQVVGIPTGLHGAFRDYQVDALTLRFMPSSVTLSDGSKRAYQYLSAERAASAYRAGRTVESMVRCLNNLLESFHHASSLYLLVGGDRFVPISTYIIPFFLLLIGLPLKAASLCMYDIPGACHPVVTNPSTSATPAVTPTRPAYVPWAHALGVVGRVYCWALLSAALVPLAITTLGEIHKRSSLPLGPVEAALLVLLSSLALALAMRTKLWSKEKPKAEQIESERTGSDSRWMAVKALVLLSAGVGLAAITCINFSLALAYEVMFVPLCLSAHPLRLSFRRLLPAKRSSDPKSAKKFTERGVVESGLQVCREVFNLLWAPLPIALFVTYWVSVRDGRESVLLVLWKWAEVHCWWGSAMFTYTMLGLLPTCILCTHVFLS